MIVRRLLKWLLVALTLAAAALLAAGFALYTGADTSTVGKLDFANELAVPSLLEPSEDEDGRKVFRLDLQTGTSEFLPGTKTETWGANGPYLAPTLRASRGERVSMRVHNGLPESTTVHWHGMHLPAVADGSPHQPIAVRDTWRPEWTIDQPAATLWYHPHPHGDTEQQVYRGVVGMFILDDPESRALALPKTYGVDDIPVIIQDKKLKDDGALDVSPGMVSPTGLLGDDIVINSTYDPHLNVATERVRLRLLNASGARSYNIGLGDDRRFDLIATDGGLLEAPTPMKRLQLSPAERAEIVVAVEPGERTVLRSYEPALGSDFWTERFAGGSDTFDLLELRVAKRLRPSPPVPRQLARVEAPSGGRRVARTRSFELSGQSSINGRKMDLARIDATARVGTTEVWNVRNRGNTPHNFHVHDVRFRVARYAGEQPPPRLAGWKDSVYVPPNESVRLVVRFSDYADPSTPYMFHCHIHQHQDRGMMGQFRVVERGG